MKQVIRLALVLLIVGAIALAVTIKLRRTSTAKAPQKGELIVHEWGTFTSIAGKDGVALEWRPLNGATDLPKFVHTADKTVLGLRHVQSKGDMTAVVRMETPVIYFYANREMNVSAQVDFPKGKITEWYPQSRTVGNGVNWGAIKVEPGAAFNLPADYSANHYYAARETDSAPVQVCGTSGKPSEQEKFLFYRGVGTFELPVAVTLEKDRVTLRNSGPEAISQVIVFENRDGRVGFRTLNNFTGSTTIDRPALDQSAESVIQRLRTTLIAEGLYEREADAMIKTWRNSWFEPGMRVLYVLPRRTTDAVLPIKIDPEPNDLVRVLVGRTEVITPEMEKSVEERVKLLTNPNESIRREARADIQKYGRFSEPILKQLLAIEKNRELRDRIKQLIQVPISE